MNNNNYEEYEPTEEEWREIEEAIIREEEEEMRIAEKEDAEELKVFKSWLKENGMTWDIENAQNVKRRKI